MRYDKSLCAVLAVTAAVFLGACDKADSADAEQAKPVESEHTVDWYKEHYETAKEKSEWCRQDAAREMTTDCMNAMKAANSVMLYGNDDEWHFPDVTSKKSNDSGKTTSESGEEFSFPDVTIRPSKKSEGQ